MILILAAFASGVAIGWIGCAVANRDADKHRASFDATIDGLARQILERAADRSAP